MNPSGDAASRKTIALARIFTGAIFILFGEYKIAAPTFAHETFFKYLTQYIGADAVGFYKIFLAKMVLPHAVFFGYFVGWAELLTGIALVLGLWVRPASVLGALHMLNLTLATWNAPGPGPVWRYFGNELDHIPLIFLFAIFFVTRAGETWGLDSARYLRREY